MPTVESSKQVAEDLNTVSHGLEALQALGAAPELAMRERGQQIARLLKQDDAASLLQARELVNGLVLEVVGAYRQIAAANIPGVIELGGWKNPDPERFGRQVSQFLERVPGADSRGHGLDAGLSVALGLIPREMASLAATLHGGYPPASVEQIRRELGNNPPETIDPDSPTAYWLCGCAVCSKKDEVTPIQFIKQIQDMREYLATPEDRKQAAATAFAEMREAFYAHSEFPQITHGRADGCIQGGYVYGNPIGVLEPAPGVYFIGTALKGGFDAVLGGNYRAGNVPEGLTIKRIAEGFYMIRSDANPPLAVEAHAQFLRHVLSKIDPGVLPRVDRPALPTDLPYPA